MRTVLVLILFAGGLIANAQGKLGGKRLRSDEPCPEAGFFPDSSDCRKFYRCAEHKNKDGTSVLSKYEFRCPPGTVYDDAISTCNHLSSVENPPQDCTAEEPPPEESTPEGEDSRVLTPILLSYSPGWFTHFPLSNYLIRV